jgi:hypothetical protein
MSKEGRVVRRSTESYVVFGFGVENVVNAGGKEMMRLKYGHGYNKFFYFIIFIFIEIAINS